MQRVRQIARWLAVGVAIVFGVMTLISGGKILFATGAEGPGFVVVPWVLWFNFLAGGFGQLAAGAGLALKRRWAVWLAVALSVASVIVLIAFVVYAVAGGEYAERTAAAMPFRTALWIVWSTVAWWVTRAGGNSGG